METFATVESAKTAIGYTVVHGSMGVAIVQDGKFTLTELGLNLLKSPTPRTLIKVLEGNIVGVSEILEAFAKEALSEKQIWTYLNDSLSLGWKTFAQIRFRLIWLQNTGAVEKLENGSFKARTIE